MKEIIKRLFSDTPTFFKRLRAFGAWLTGISVAFYTAVSQFPGLEIPKWVEKPLSYTTLAGVLITILASLPVSNPEDIKK